LSAAAIALLLGACASPSPPANNAAPATQAAADAKEGDEKGKEGLSFARLQAEIPHAQVGEAWVSPADPDDNLDSPASWHGADGRLYVAMTAKKADTLVVFDGDGGARLRTVGGPGKAPGRLGRPNGISIVDDRYAFVVERDNRRVQMFELPGFRPLATFGESELQKPYGLWVRARKDAYEVIVSDAYMAGEDANGDDIVPPLERLDHRFRRYLVRRTPAGWQGALAGSFGDTGEAGAVRTPESVFGDEANDRLLIAEEDVATGTRLREYTLAGKYAGRDVGAGVYRAQAEGIALMRCGDGTGWWVASDQFDDRTVFHVFERNTLRHAGSFVGDVTGLTDGVWIEERGDARFPEGALFASNLDVSLSAFDWRDIRKALKLGPCAR
jgi:3-phytase